MPEIARTRDCILFYKGDIYPAETQLTSWLGGQGAMWVTVPGDRRMLTVSDGRFGGIFLWGSNEASDQYNAMTGQFLRYGYAILAAGGNLISTTTYERYTYASRLIPPLVPLVYTAGNPLYFSLRGYWTPEDEMTLSGHPMAPASVSGYTAQIPKESNRHFLGVYTTC